MTEPGDVVHIVRQVRQLLAHYDTVGYILGGTMEDIDADLDPKVTQLRPLLAQTSDMLFDLLTQLEQTPAYRRQRTRALARREKER